MFFVQSTKNYKNLQKSTILLQIRTENVQKISNNVQKITNQLHLSTT